MGGVSGEDTDEGDELDARLEDVTDEDGEISEAFTGGGGGVGTLMETIPREGQRSIDNKWPYRVAPQQR